MFIDLHTEIVSLSSVMQRQMPFAVALALTRTAQDAQEEIRQRLPVQFHLKNTWTARNIRIKAATKANWEAIITAPDYMAKQETGGELQPESSRHLAGPTDLLRGRRIPRGMKPSALLDRDDTFILTRNGHTAIAQRAGRKGKKLRILWWLTATQDYKPRFHMGETVADSVRTHFAMRLADALQYAEKTAL